MLEEMTFRISLIGKRNFVSCWHNQNNEQKPVFAYLDCFNLPIKWAF